MKDYEGAINDFNKALDLNPNYRVIYYDMGSARSKLKDDEGAIADYDRAIEFFPNFFEAYYSRGFSKHNTTSSANTYFVKCFIGARLR